MKPRTSPAINMEALRTAYFGVKEAAVPGVDGETWLRYGDALEENLRGLYERLRRGKGLLDRNGGPGGFPQLENHIVRRAALEMRGAIY